MSDDAPDKQAANHRCCDRLPIPRRLLLELDNGEFVGGKTHDISPRGALLNADATPKNDLLGVAGTLFVISGDDEFSIGYPCRVVRHQGRSVAIEIHKNAAAAFAAYITRDLLGR